MSSAASQKIVSRERLREIMDASHAEHRTVVFTNGCFDLLHIGHARYLAEARAYGDLLVVGLNSDASVRALKGPRRPLIPQAERAEMLAHLASVDYVSVFDETTADALIEVVRPRFYVKGGDVDVARIPELPTVERCGGRVIVAQYVAERSTSEIITRVLTAYEQAGS
ncbi:MAG: D-glycero-beta-D-manno-heptose 1-phosphate adenylyltransferase [Chthonomonadales bacterium]|nr:D-glycero-beta-D-manno-heptose 1-phosphate adenylyltransferase [Chthonomonadales bacterium]